MRGTMIRQIRSTRIFMAMISCVHYEVITGHVGRKRRPPNQGLDKFDQTGTCCRGLCGRIAAFTILVDILGKGLSLKPKPIDPAGAIENDDLSGVGTGEFAHRGLCALTNPLKPAFAGCVPTFEASFAG
jgi:hypothetical protein